MISKITILLLLLLLFNYKSNSQLNSNINNEEKSKINNLIERCTEDNSPESNIILANEAYNLALKLNYTAGLINSLYALGFNYLRSSDYTRSNFFFQEYINIVNTRRQNNSPQQEAECYRLIGENFRAINSLDSSLYYLRIAEKKFININDPKGLAKTYNRMAAVYLQRYLYNDSKLVIEYTRKSNTIALINGFNDIVANNYNILASFYRVTNEYEKAIEIYHKSLNQIMITQEYSEESNTLYNVSETFKRMNLLDSSLYYMRLAYSSAIKYNLYNSIAGTARGLADIFYLMKINMDSVSYYLDISNKYYAIISNDDSKRSEIVTQIKIDSQLKDLQLSKQKELLAYQLTISLVLVLLLIAIILFIYLKNKSQKKINESIKIQNEKLEELNQSKDKFFSILAHDLKNPIAVLKSLSSMLEKDFSVLSEEEKLDFVRILAESSNSILDLLENLLTWSRSQRNQIEYAPNFTDFYQIVISALTISKITAEEKNIEIINEIPAHTVAYFDSNMAYTILRNLLTNSIKFSYPNSKIYIKGENTTINDHKFIKISIIDEGVGMSEEVKENLFSIRDKSSSLGTNGEKGTGLGLIIVKEFVTSNKGQIWVDSTLGNGTKIHFTLPKSIVN